MKRKRKLTRSATSKKASGNEVKTTSPKGEKVSVSNSADSPGTKKPRKRQIKDNPNPAELLAEMKDLEKRLRATVGGTECPETEFKRIVDHLRTVCPPPKMCKVIVDRCDPEEMTAEHGSCLRERNVFTIYINRALNEYETEHVLIHEWAHMLSWRPYHPLMGDHGSDWGVWYAMVWRKYHGVE